MSNSYDLGSLSINIPAALNYYIFNSGPGTSWWSAGYSGYVSDTTWTFFF